MSIIDIKNISKVYHLGTVEVHAIRDISLQIEKNEYVAIMGPSGSGKSTLMNIIGCLDSPTGGSYALNGTDVSRLGDNALAEIRNNEIGFVFQMFNLLPRLTALDNVALPLVYADVKKVDRVERALEMLEMVGLSDRVNHRPNQLSGGQQQRVAIARSLICKPSIILADEPTGNLDSKVSEDILKFFDDIHAAGNTVILVTHEDSIAAHARRIITLLDGLIDVDTIKVPSEELSN